MADKKISALTAATTPLAGTEVLPIVQSSTTVKASIANIQATPVAVGTANAIQFLNASKVPTTSANLLFDGAVVALGGTSSAWSGVGNVVQLTGTALWGSSAVGHISVNTYFDGSNYKYLTTDFVTDYYQFNGQHVFRFAPSGTAGNNVSFTTAFNTTSAGNIAFPNGQGIDFSATPGTGTSELLADYEEGTFTPTVASTTGTITTLANVSGSYTKIGNLVYLSITFQITNIGTGSGSLNITNLPFSGTANRVAGVAREIAVNGFTGSVYINGATSLNLVNYVSGDPIATNAYWLISVSYLV